MPTVKIGVKNTILSFESPPKSSKSIETNDLYLAAFLLCKGIRLVEVVYYRTDKATLVMAGEDIDVLREEYQSGSVRVDLKALKKSYNKIRTRMRYAYPTQRSFPCSNQSVLSVIN